MVYDPSQQKWVPTTNDSSGGVVNSPTPSPTPTGGGNTSTSSTPPTSSSSKTQVNSSGKANREQAVLEYNTLEGEVTLRARVGVLKIKENSTIELDGVGSYLSGKYFVSGVSYSLDANSGFSMSCTLVKTGFGDSVKSGGNVASNEQGSKEVLEKSEDVSYSKGDSVNIVGDDATYSNSDAGVRVPNWVKQKTLTVQEVSSDGTRVLLQPINSWTYTKYIQKV